MTTYHERVNLYVRSPNGLLHRLKPRNRHSRSLHDHGYLRTICGRLVERGWSQKPKAIHNPDDPHVCGVCKAVMPSA